MLLPHNNVMFLKLCFTESVSTYRKQLHGLLQMMAEANKVSTFTIISLCACVCMCGCVSACLFVLLLLLVIHWLDSLRGHVQYSCVFVFIWYNNIARKHIIAGNKRHHHLGGVTDMCDSITSYALWQYPNKIIMAIFQFLLHYASWCQTQNWTLYACIALSLHAY